MKVAIIISSKDKAGINIKKNLMTIKKWTRVGLFDNFHYYEYKDNKNTLFLITTQKESIYNENIDIDIENVIKTELDLVIFATKHVSKSGIPSLSVHTQGNWDRAEFGGKYKTLAIAPANILKTALIKLEHHAEGKDYDIIQEATHHGPDISRPSIFIEIGSKEEEWKNPIPGKILAETIIDLLEGKILDEKIAIGIGGLHTTPIFKKLMDREGIAIGHVCPKYMLEKLDKEMILQAIDKTYPKAELILLDWKGMGKEKERITTMLDELHFGYDKIKFN